MAKITIGERSVEVPNIEVLAAFRQSFRTAEREGFPRTAFQVLGYLRELEAMDREFRQVRDEAWEAEEEADPS